MLVLQKHIWPFPRSSYIYKLYSFNIPWATSVEGLLLLGHPVDDGGDAFRRLGFGSRLILLKVMLLLALLSLLGRR